MIGPMKVQIIRGIHHVRCCSDIRKFLLIVPDIITKAEEEAIVRFVHPKLQRKRYEGNHWDNVISKYKETEMSAANMPTEVLCAVERITSLIRDATGFNQMVMMPPHVLDLSADGFIGPHVDSIKFSGGIVAGLSLLSTRLMRLSPDNNDDNFRSAQLRTTISCDRTPYYILGDTNHEINDQKEKEHYRFDPFGETDSIYEGSIEMKLNRRSLYILSGPLRYTFAHEIFGPDSVSQLFSETESVVPERRLSVIFRDELPRAKE